MQGAINRMKRFVSTLAISAALGWLPASAQDATSFHWTGAYVGGLVGYAKGETGQRDFMGISNPFDVRGFTAGATAGYNFQIGSRLLVGLEADISGSAIGGAFGPGNLGSQTGGGWACNPGPCETDVSWYATVRGRLGYTHNRFLVYGTGGLAIANVNSQIRNAGLFYAKKDTDTGWAAGAGAEYAFTDNWTAKVEYLHIDLGWTKLNLNDFGSRNRFDTLRFGVNYRF